MWFVVESSLGNSFRSRSSSILPEIRIQLRASRSPGQSPLPLLTQESALPPRRKRWCPLKRRQASIGHSFGGLIVYAAVAQYLTDQAATLEVKSLIAGPGPDGERIAERGQIAGYGDLVVVINPAIEATRYEPIREILDRAPQRAFAPWQPPVLIEVTSVGDSTGSGDWATGTVFPIGRFFSTLGQDIGGSFRSGEYTQAVTAFGHYPDFWTHLDQYQPRCHQRGNLICDPPGRRMSVPSRIQSRISSRWLPGEGVDTDLR